MLFTKQPSLASVLFLNNILSVSDNKPCITDTTKTCKRMLSSVFAPKTSVPRAKSAKGAVGVVARLI